jgi:hypothetical protein
VIVAINQSPVSYKALDFAAELCRKRTDRYQLIPVYVVALNPPQSLPFM